MNPTAAMLADLARSKLTSADVRQLQLTALDGAEVKARTSLFSVPAYEIPYLDEHREATGFYRLRFLADARRFGAKKAQRYWQPGGSPPQLYLPPTVDWVKTIEDPGITVTLTEGEKKAAAGCKQTKAPVAALGGVWNFTSKEHGVELLPELERLAADGRTVLIAFDGDDPTKPNPDVKLAEQRLAGLLAIRGANVQLVRLPAGYKLDDFLVKYGPDDLAKLPREAFDVKATVQAARRRKVSERDRKDLVAGIVTQDLGSRGSFHHASEEPLYFDQSEHRLLSLLTRDDGALRAYLVDRFGINAAETEFRFVYEHLCAQALRHGAPALTPLFAHFDRTKALLHVDVGGNRIARVDAKGWALVPNGTDGRLFRDCSTQPVEPAKRGSEKDLKDMLALPNFDDSPALSKRQQALAWELHFWSLFFPTLLPTRPLVLLNAVKGSGKTAGSRAVGLTLFGPDFDVTPVDRNKLDDLSIAMIQNPLLVLDNLDGRVPGLNNLLAVASTGGKMSRRVLYTTMKEVKVPLRSRIIATSRAPDVFVRDDIRDRTIILSLKHIERFRAESDIVGDVLSRRPAVWTYVLNQLPALVKALAKSSERRVVHRLADFAQFCLDVGPTLGHKTQDVEAMLDAFENKRTQFASEHSPLLQALSYWIDRQREFAAMQTAGKRVPLGCERLTAGQLLKDVSEAWPPGAQFPFRNPQQFGLALKNEEPTLRATFHIKRVEARGNTAFYTIRPREQGPRG